MLFLAIAAIAMTGAVMSKMNEERELYAPKGYLSSLQTRPRSVFSY